MRAGRILLLPRHLEPHMRGVWGRDCRGGGWDRASLSVGLLGLRVPAFLRDKRSDGGVVVDAVKDVSVGSGRGRGEGVGDEGGRKSAVA